MVKMKTVVITGAAGGMGSATATLFKSKGYQVLATDREEIKGVDFQVVGDVANEATWQKISIVFVIVHKSGNQSQSSQQGNG